ncbi:hypothetical protein Ciccas_004560 [Cichlidogyrus casuarinus]|uniref:Uncharacterized protein n=1 Tax=Cichlidogyrus casuarinus TaxID=1844966 RepID=A0ABD2QEN9_9PLAT
MWMLKFSCQVIDSNPSSSNGLSESVAKKVIGQLEYVLRPESWRGTCGPVMSAVDLKLTFIERFLTLEEPQPQQTTPVSQAATKSQATTGAAATAPVLKPDQSGGVLMTLEVLKVFFSQLEPSTILCNMRYFSRSLSQLIMQVHFERSKQFSWHE